MKTIVCCLLLVGTGMLAAQNYPPNQNAPAPGKPLEPRVGRLEKIVLPDMVERYERTYIKTLNSVELVTKMEEAYNSVALSLNSVRSYNLLAQANNPASDVLGFRFSEVVLQTADTHLDLPDRDRSRLNNMLTSIFSTTTQASSIISTNPVTFALSALVGGLSNFFVARTETRQSGRRVEGYETVLDPAFTSEEIAEFMEELRPYIAFYEALSVENQRFYEALNELESRYGNFPDRLQRYKILIEDELDVSIDRDIYNQINTLFRYSESSSPGFDHYNVLMGSQLGRISDQIDNVSNLAPDLFGFYDEFIGLVNRNMNANLDQLQKANELPVFKEDGTDTRALRRLQEQIREAQRLFQDPFSEKMERIRFLSRRVRG